MKRTLLIIGIILVGALAINGGINTGVSVQAQTSASNASINVSGSADVKVVPDEVIITLGVETADAILLNAKISNDDRVKAILSLRDRYGLKPEQMQTDYISIEPRYVDYNDRRTVQTYVVRKTIVITLKDISRFEDLLTDSLAAGANYVNNIEFRTTELRKYRDQARELALKAAREKASAMAGILGKKVGEVTSISENSGYWWSSYRSFWGGYGAQSQNVVQNAGGGSGGAGSASDDSAIAPGQITISASVQVTFELNK